MVGKRHPDWTLDIAGKGDDRALTFLQGLIDKAGIGSQCVLCGFRTDMAELYAESEVFVLSSPRPLIASLPTNPCATAWGRTPYSAPRTTTASRWHGCGSRKWIGYANNKCCRLSLRTYFSNVLLRISVPFAIL